MVDFWLRSWCQLRLAIAARDMLLGDLLHQLQHAPLFVAEQTHQPAQHHHLGEGA
jgi:hypothetical protein